MALLRFRLPASGSAPVSPALQSYTHTQSTWRSLPETDATALATQAYTPDAADHGVAGDAHHVQFVSDALATGTVFDVGNTIKLCLQGLEPNANCNQSLQVWVGVYSSDGSTLRQTLRGKVTAAEFNTALRSVFLSTTVATAYTTVSGDRLVVEISCAGSPAGGGGVQGHNASMRWGSDGAGGDLLENDTQTGTTLNPWFEIASTTAQTFPQTLAATAVGVVTLTTLSTYLRTLAAAALGVAVLTPARVILQTLAATAVGVSTLATALLFSITMAATAVAVATLSKIVIFGQAVVSTAVGVASLITEFIAGGGAAVGGVMAAIRRNRRS